MARRRKSELQIAEQQIGGVPSVSPGIPRQKRFSEAAAVSDTRAGRVAQAFGAANQVLQGISERNVRSTEEKIRERKGILSSRARVKGMDEAYALVADENVRNEIQNSGANAYKTMQAIINEKMAGLDQNNPYEVMYADQFYRTAVEKLDDVARKSVTIADAKEKSRITSTIIRKTEDLLRDQARDKTFAADKEFLQALADVTLNEMVKENPHWSKSDRVQAENQWWRNVESTMNDIGQKINMPNLHSVRNANGLEIRPMSFDESQAYERVGLAVIKDNIKRIVHQAETDVNNIFVERSEGTLKESVHEAFSKRILADPEYNATKGAIEAALGQFNRRLAVSNSVSMERVLAKIGKAQKGSEKIQKILKDSGLPKTEQIKVMKMLNDNPHIIGGLMMDGKYDIETVTMANRVKLFNNAVANGNIEGQARIIASLDTPQEQSGFNTNIWKKMDTVGHLDMLKQHGYDGGVDRSFFFQRLEEEMQTSIGVQRVARRLFNDKDPETGESELMDFIRRQGRRLDVEADMGSNVGGRTTALIRLMDEKVTDETSFNNVVDKILANPIVTKSQLRNMFKKEDIQPVIAEIIGEDIGANLEETKFFMTDRPYDWFLKYAEVMMNANGSRDFSLGVLKEIKEFRDEVSGQFSAYQNDGFLISTIPFAETIKQIATGRDDGLQKWQRIKDFFRPEGVGRLFGAIFRTKPGEVFGVSTFDTRTPGEHIFFNSKRGPSRFEPGTPGQEEFVQETITYYYMDVVNRAREAGFPIFRKIPEGLPDPKDIRILDVEGRDYYELWIDKGNGNRPAPWIDSETGETRKIATPTTATGRMLREHIDAFLEGREPDWRSGVLEFKEDATPFVERRLEEMNADLKERGRPELKQLPEDELKKIADEYFGKEYFLLGSVKEFRKMFFEDEQGTLPEGAGFFQKAGLVASNNSYIKLLNDSLDELEDALLGDDASQISPGEAKKILDGNPMGFDTLRQVLNKDVGIFEHVRDVIQYGPKINTYRRDKYGQGFKAEIMMSHPSRYVQQVLAYGVSRSGDPNHWAVDNEEDFVERLRMNAMHMLFAQAISNKDNDIGISHNLAIGAVEPDTLTGAGVAGKVLKAVTLSNGARMLVAAGVDYAATSGSESLRSMFYDEPYRSDIPMASAIGGPLLHGTGKILAIPAKPIGAAVKGAKSRFSVNPKKETTVSAGAAGFGLHFLDQDPIELEASTNNAAVMVDGFLDNTGDFSSVNIEKPRESGNVLGEFPETYEPIPEVTIDLDKVPAIITNLDEE